MKINHEQSQQVPLDHPKIAKDAHQAKAAAKGARAGHLAGDNLNIGRETGGKPVQSSNQQGIPKPVLNVPSSESTAVVFQATLGHLNQAVLGNKTELMQQLKSAGNPIHSQPASGGAREVSVGQTENGFSGQVDGKDFNIDSKNKTMSLPVEGKTVQISLGAGGNVSALADGAPLDLNQSEVKAYTDFFALMALFHEMGVEQRQMSRQGRNMANEAVVQKIKMQASEQRSAAQAKMVAGMVSGSVKVASGGLNMVGSMKGMKADQAAAQAGSNQMPGNMIAQQWSGFGQMMAGVGEAGSSMLQFKAGLHEARSTELRAEEEQARFIKQTEQDQMQVAQELSSKARDTFSQVWNQYLQTQQNITRNI